MIGRDYDGTVRRLPRRIRSAPPMPGADGHDQTRYSFHAIFSDGCVLITYSAEPGSIKRHLLDRNDGQRDHGPLFMDRDFVAGLVFFRISRPGHEECAEQELSPPNELQIRTGPDLQDESWQGFTCCDLLPSVEPLGPSTEETLPPSPPCTPGPRETLDISSGGVEKPPTRRD